MFMCCYEYMSVDENGCCNYCGNNIYQEVVEYADEMDIKAAAQKEGDKDYITPEQMSEVEKMIDIVRPSHKE